MTPLRILVADDNRDTVLTLTMLLTHERHEVRSACNGTDVMRIAHVHRFDAVILDIEMPEMSGCRRPGTAHTPLRHAYAAAHRDLGQWNKPSEKLLAQAVGFDHHLEKPCNPSTLIRLLEPLRLRAGPAPWELPRAGIEPAIKGL